MHCSHAHLSRILVSTICVDYRAIASYCHFCSSFFPFLFPFHVAWPLCALPVWGRVIVKVQPMFLSCCSDVAYPCSGSSQQNHVEMALRSTEGGVIPLPSPQPPHPKPHPPPPSWVGSILGRGVSLRFPEYSILPFFYGCCKIISTNEKHMEKSTTHI